MFGQHWNQRTICLQKNSGSCVINPEACSWTETNIIVVTPVGRLVRADITLRWILTPSSFVGRELGKCISVKLDSSSNDLRPVAFRLVKSPINCLIRSARKGLSGRFVWLGDSYSRIYALMKHLSTRSYIIFSATTFWNSQLFHNMILIGHSYQPHPCMNCILGLQMNME